MVTKNEYLFRHIIQVITPLVRKHTVIVLFKGVRLILYEGIILRLQNNNLTVKAQPTGCVFFMLIICATSIGVLPT